MATWAQLTQAQRDEVTQELTAVREWAGMMARLANLGRAIAAKHAGNVETTLALLDAGEIPVCDVSQGEEELTKAELLTLAGYAIDASATPDGSPGSYNTAYHRAMFVRAAGLYNTLQQGNGR
jgi:hypothetical protein